MTIPWPMAFNVTRIPWESGGLRGRTPIKQSIASKTLFVLRFYCVINHISCLFGRIVKTMPLGTVDS